MRKFACPSCGADVTFQSAQSVYTVCAYCQSMVVRTDVDVKSIGVMAALPDDMALGGPRHHRARRLSRPPFWS